MQSSRMKCHRYNFPDCLLASRARYSGKFQACPKLTQVMLHMRPGKTRGFQDPTAEIRSKLSVTAPNGATRQNQLMIRTLSKAIRSPQSEPALLSAPGSNDRPDIHPTCRILRSGRTASFRGISEARRRASKARLPSRRNQWRRTTPWPRQRRS